MDGSVRKIAEKEHDQYFSDTNLGNSTMTSMNYSYSRDHLILQTWYAKTPLGKKRAKAAAGDDEGDKKGKKGKKGGKKKKK